MREAETSSQSDVLAAEHASEWFLVKSYEVLGGALQEVDTMRVASRNDASLLGEAATAAHPTVIVVRQIEDDLGVVRSDPLQIFEQS